jgi:hypothetical protein
MSPRLQLLSDKRIKVRKLYRLWHTQVIGHRYFLLIRTLLLRVFMHHDLHLPLPPLLQPAGDACLLLISLRSQLTSELLESCMRSRGFYLLEGEEVFNNSRKGTNKFSGEGMNASL